MWFGTLSDRSGSESGFTDATSSSGSMTKSALIAGSLMIAVFTAAFTLDPGQDALLKIGDQAPMTDKALITTDGSKLTLNGARGEKGLLVIFSCNTCPWVEKWEDRYHVVAKAASDGGIGTILLNSNEALRDGEESLEAMRERATKMNYTFPYAVDPAAALADAFGANRTPEVFLFDSEMKLIYHGAIDDNARDASAVESPFLMDALASYAAGKTIEPNDTKSIGCTIKRKR